MKRNIVKKIYYHDTDSGGVVYYANYLKYFEEARTEYLSDAGLDLNLLSAEGILFVVRRTEVDYRFPARYADRIEITTEISKIKRVSLEFIQEARKKDKLLVTAKTILGCVNTSFSPQRLPPQIAAFLTR